MPIKPTTVFICSARVHLLLIAHQNSSFPDARVDVTAVSFFLYSFFVFLNRGLKNQKLTMDNSKTQVIISQPFSVVMSPFSAHFFPFFKSAFKIDRTRYPAAKGSSRKQNPPFFARPLKKEAWVLGLNFNSSLSCHLLVTAVTNSNTHYHSLMH
jgi:hypothetical protein